MRELLARLAAPAAAPASLWRVPGRLAYVVSHSYPYSSNGYAVRTHGVASALAGLGHSVVAVSRPGNPWDLPGFDGQGFCPHHDIDGVRYLHLREPSAKGLPRAAYLAASVEALKTALRVFKPVAVMAASNWENALPAALAARELGLPFFYEVRGFWEISRASKEPGWEGGAEFKRDVDMETAVARAADRVFTLNRFMREELARRGVDAAKIDLTPNACGGLPDLSRPPRLGRAGLGCDTRHVVGYAGSFNDYEGLDDLVRACARLQQGGLDLSLLLVGSSNSLGLAETADQCPASARLRRLAQELGFAERLRLPGRVAPGALADYYALMDLVVIPRRPLPVCELVPPIKPLEAAAHGKAILASDVAPLAEMAEESKAMALFRKADMPDLAAQIARLLADEAGRREAGARAREWAAGQRSAAQSVEPIARALAALGSPAKASPPKSLPGGARLPRLQAAPGGRLRVAAVMDEFTFHAYDPECEILQLHPEIWRSQLASFKPDLLFIESAWRGLDDLWRGKISPAAPEILAAIEWCGARSVPSMLWNKEDPAHFNHFLPVARRVDYVFTTDIDCIPRYKRELGHGRVYLLPFAAQPKIHNPVELYDRQDAFCFAGSYYLRYPERQRDFAALIDAVQAFRPVDIYDRNYANPSFSNAFPERYAPMIRGNLPFAEIDRAYKGYRYGINMNSIKQSQSMFARRVFELLASNTIVVSNFSRGVRLLFGDLVVCSDDAGQLARRLGDICRDDEAGYRRRRLLGLRKVMSEHTYRHRLAYIRAKLSGADYENPLAPRVTIFAVARNAEERGRLLAQFERQQYPDKRLLLLSESGPAPGAGVEVFTDPARCLEALQGGSAAAGLLGVFSAADDYGPHYLTDLALASVYSGADAFGKSAHYQVEGQSCALVGDGGQYRPAPALAARSALARADMVGPDRLAEWLRRPDAAALALPNMLAVDEFNYCRGGAALDPALLRQATGDLPCADPGGSFIGDLAPVAEAMQADAGEAEEGDDDLPQLGARQLAEWLPPTAAAGKLTLGLQNGVLRLDSRLAADKYIYVYASKVFSREELNFLSNNAFKLKAQAGCDLKTVFEFQDGQGQKISHAFHAVGEENLLPIPTHCQNLRFGLRVQGTGTAEIHSLVLGASPPRPATLVGRSPCLVVARQYPDYGAPCDGGSLHSRVSAYKAHALPVEVFLLSEKREPPYREFEDIDIASGDARLLDGALRSGRYKQVLAHQPDEAIWDVLRRHIDALNVAVWVGAEDFRAGPPLAFWRELLGTTHRNVKFVFTSRRVAEEAAEEHGFKISEGRYEIVHDPTVGREIELIRAGAEGPAGEAWLAESFLCGESARAAAHEPDSSLVPVEDSRPWVALPMSGEKTLLVGARFSRAGQEGGAEGLDVFMQAEFQGGAGGGLRRRIAAPRGGAGGGRLVVFALSAPAGCTTARIGFGAGAGAAGLRVENAIGISRLREGVSVIVPSYKGEKTLEGCLVSLARQTLPPGLFEIVVVINGERDNSGQVVEAVRRRFPDVNFQVLVLDEAGAGNARNCGIALAGREYLTLVDDDDQVSEGYLKALLQAAAPDTIAIAQIVDIKGGKPEENLITHQIRDALKEPSAPYKNIHSVLTMNACKLVPSRFSKQISFDTSLRSGEDVDYWVRLIVKFSPKIKIVPEDAQAVYRRLIRDNSVSRQPASFDFNVRQRLDVIKKIDAEFKGATDAGLRAFAETKIKTQAGFVVKYLKNNPGEHPRFNELIQGYAFEFPVAQYISKWF